MAREADRHEVGDRYRDTAEIDSEQRSQKATANFDVIPLVGDYFAS